MKAFQKEDDASMIRFEMACGKAYAALSLGRCSSLVGVRQQEKPEFVRFLIGGGRRPPVCRRRWPLIRNGDGDVIGAVGVTGDTEERDEELAIHGIRAAGLKIDLDFEGKGRQFIVRRTKDADGRDPAAFIVRGRAK